MNVLYAPGNLTIRAEDFDFLKSALELPKIEKFTFGAELKKFIVTLKPTTDDVDQDAIDAAINNVHIWAQRRRVTGARGARVALIKEPRITPEAIEIEVHVSPVAHYNERRYAQTNATTLECIADVQQLVPYIDELEFAVEVNLENPDGTTIVLYTSARDCGCDMDDCATVNDVSVVSLVRELRLQSALIDTTDIEQEAFLESLTDLEEIIGQIKAKFE